MQVSCCSSHMLVTRHKQHVIFFVHLRFSQQTYSFVNLLYKYGFLQG